MHLHQYIFVFKAFIGRVILFKDVFLKRGTLFFNLRIIIINIYFGKIIKEILYGVNLIKKMKVY